MELPARVSEVLNHDASIRVIAADMVEARDVLYLGRGLLYPIALEGALKLKEISHIHAEGYAAGEMKHGPIALIDEDVPIVVRSEEHTSELQSLMRISYAVFCLKKKKRTHTKKQIADRDVMQGNDTRPIRITTEARTVYKDRRQQTQTL